MKKVITLYLALFAAFTLSAQWGPVYTDASKTYHDIDFPTAMDGFVVGAYNNNGGGFILKTTDGGINWTEIALPAGFYNQIAMYSATEGYVSAGGGWATLLYTNDAFTTTVSNPLDASFATIGLDIINDSTGFYMNNDSHFRSFEHYGDTFHLLMDTLFGNGSFDVADPSTIYVGNQFQLIKSTDAGATWFAVNDSLPAYVGMSLVFINADTGYYLRNGGPGIWQTVDGGISFQTVDNYYGIFLDARGPWCASIFGLGTIRWSSDYGQNWTLESLGMFNSHGVFITPGGDCFVTNNQTGEIRKRQMPLSTESITSASSAVSVFPNPANDLITVSFNDGAMSANARFTVVNTLGETVLETTLPRDGRVSIAGLAAGVYTYQVWTSDELTGTGLITKQ